jgi:hypothetical protein
MKKFIIAFLVFIGFTSFIHAQEKPFHFSDISNDTADGDGGCC